MLQQVINLRLVDDITLCSFLFINFTSDPLFKFCPNLCLGACIHFSMGQLLPWPPKFIYESVQLVLADVPQMRDLSCNGPYKKEKQQC